MDGVEFVLLSTSSNVTQAKHAWDCSLVLLFH